MIGGPIKVPPKPKRRPGNRESGGNYPYEYGQIVREPNTDYLGKWLQARQRARELQQRERAANRRAAVEADSHLRFEHSAEHRLHTARARAHVALALRAADADLERRRYRLRELLRCEDAALTAEMVARAQQAPAEHLQRARAQEEQLKAQRDAAQQERVEELRLLQYRSRYIDLRDIERKRLNAITRDSQIYQMHEKAWLRQKTKEEDSFWEEVIKKNQAAMAEREEQEERAVKSRALETARAHREAMEAARRGAADERLRAQKEAATLHALIAEMDKQEDESGAGKQKKQAAVREALDRQRAQKHALHCALEAAERRFDLAQALYARAETEREDLSKAIATEKKRQEVHLYLDYKRAEKRQMLQRELEDERQLQDVAWKANADREKRRQELEDEQYRREQEAHQGLLAQLEERRVRARAAVAEEAAEEEARAAARSENQRLHRESIARGHENALRYQRDLCEQRHYAVTLKERERRLEQERLEQGQLEEAEMKRRVLQLFNKHYPNTINSLQAAALAHPPPDQALPVPPPPPPRRPCDAERAEILGAGAEVATRGVAGAMAAAGAAAARQRSPPPRRPAPLDAAGVGSCDQCGGFRVFAPCAPCAEPCAEAAFGAAREAHWRRHDKAGAASLSGPWGAWLEEQQRRGASGLGAVLPPRWPPPPTGRAAANCHAPPHAQPLFPNPFACAETAMREAAAASAAAAPAAPAAAVPPQPRCYMCRCP